MVTRFGRMMLGALALLAATALDGQARPLGTYGFQLLDLGFTMVMTPGATTGAQIAPGSLTAALFALGAVPTTETGVCRNGHALRGVNADGSVSCTTVTTVVGPTSGPVAALVGRDGLPIPRVSRARWQWPRRDALRRPRLRQRQRHHPRGRRQPQCRARLAVAADGRPRVAYYDDTAQALRLATCGDLQCTTATLTFIDDPAAGVVQAAKCGTTTCR